MSASPRLIPTSPQPSSSPTAALPLPPGSTASARPPCFYPPPWPGAPRSPAPPASSPTQTVLPSSCHHLTLCFRNVQAPTLHVALPYQSRAQERFFSNVRTREGAIQYTSRLTSTLAPFVGLLWCFQRAPRSSSPPPRPFDIGHGRRAPSYMHTRRRRHDLPLPCTYI